MNPEIEKIQQEVRNILTAKFSGGAAATVIETMMKSYTSNPAANTVEFWQMIKQSVGGGGGQPAVAASASQPAADRSKESGDWLYTEKDGSIVIAGYKGSSKEVAIPAEIDGKPVKVIGDRALAGKDLTKVTIPEGVIAFEERALASNAFTEITIPNSVTTIGKDAFSRGALINVTFGSGVKTIGEGAFQMTKITNVVIGSSVTSIGKEAFYSSKTLVSVKLPDTVLSIGYKAFNGCAITEIDFGKGEVSLDEYAFSENKLVKLTIPDSVKTIGRDAFVKNPLELVVLSERLSKKYNPLEGDKSCEPARFGSSTDIKEAKVNDTKKYISIIRDSDYAYETDPANARYAKPSEFEWKINDQRTGVAIRRYLGNATEIIFPPQVRGLPVTELGVGTYSIFKDRPVTSVTIPDSVVTIKSMAFDKCGLTNAVIGKGVKTIGEMAFSKNNLTAITIPDNVASIEVGAFRENQLTSVVIPKGVTVIERDVFLKNKLTSVTFHDGVTQIGISAFEENEFENIEFPPNLAIIGGEAFRFNKLKALTFPDSVTKICKYAFAFNKLKTIVFSKNLKTVIDDDAFTVKEHGGVRLKSITIPKGVNLNKKAFVFNGEFETKYI